MAAAACAAPQSRAAAWEEGDCCLSIQTAFVSGLIQARQSRGERGRFGLMPQMEFLLPTGVFSVGGSNSQQKRAISHAQCPLQNAGTLDKRPAHPSFEMDARPNITYHPIPMWFYANHLRATGFVTTATL